MLTFAIGLMAAVGVAQTPDYLNPQKPIEERVQDALHRMTLEEKVAMIHAQSKFSSPGVPRLGIPENWTTDGPHGIRQEVIWDEWGGAGWTNDSCTALPALTCLAATWNEQMSHLYGRTIGEEARYRNKNILLGPGCNIYRTPLNGRNFEYLGEDPYLASRMVVPYIKAVQANGVAACVKHYALNNQERWRGHINVIVDDRALHEIYLPAFHAAVTEGKAWSIMGAYNQYKGQQCCHNQYLLNDILKRDWKFDGVVVSDWGGTHDTEQAIHNGLDMEFGSWTDGMSSGVSNAYDYYYMANPYLELLRSVKVTTAELDDKVSRILRLIFRTNMAPNRPLGSFATAEHALAARTIAEEGIVLLKNDKNTLPIDPTRVRRLLVVGENATHPMTIGGGSSSLKVKYEVSPLEGIVERARRAGIEVVYKTGYASPAVAAQDVKGAVAPEKIFDLATLRAEAVEAAREADMVLFVGGLNKNSGQDCEGDDRESMALPYEQDALIEALAKANPNIAVVIISGNAVEMPWVKTVPAIIEGWYCGTEAGNALARVAFGDVNPSGKLPFTFPQRLSDVGAHCLGEHPGDSINVRYNESIFVGYRFADSRNIKPLFSFGHGLSYTKFEYSGAKISSPTIDADGTITVSVNVKNVGKCFGKEVVQLYIADSQSRLVRPAKELKGFRKVSLLPGETKTVEFTIDSSALSYYDDSVGKWVAEPGEFTAIVAASSTDPKAALKFSLK